MPIINIITIFKTHPPIKIAAMPVPHLNSPGLYVILSATIFDPSKESTQPKMIIKNVITPIGKGIRLHTLNTDNMIKMTGAVNSNIKGSILFGLCLLNTA
jgi:hypothetical protein